MDSLLEQLDDAYTLRVLQEMIRIPSIVGQEAQLAEYLQRELQAMGLQTELYEAEPGRPNVHAWLAGSRSGRKLCLAGHMDTVPVVAGWESDPLTPLLREDRLYGLGAWDMKGGLACALNTMRAFVLAGQPLNGELSFAGVIDEEGYSQGARAMMQNPLRSADAILLAEPYTGRADRPIPLGITGKILYDVHVHGKAAHAFCPQEGVNAVHEATRIISALPQLDLQRHPAFGTGSYSTIKIEGGYDVYSLVVPAYCRFEVNRLLVPGETVETAVADLERLVHSLNLEAQVEVRIKPPRYEPYVMAKDEPIVQAFDAAYRQVTGQEPCHGYVNTITDANIFTGEYGIPCLHLGPQGGGIHQKNEYVLLPSLAETSRIMAETAARFLS